MAYVAITFWLLVVVLTSWGVHELWRGLVKPKIFNVILLPGTLVAQVGHVLGLLVTGATVSNTTLIKDDEEGDPENTPNPQPRIPVIGPVIIGMLPILACGLAIFLVARYLGGPVLANMNTTIVSGQLPTSMPAFWQLLRDLVTLVESFVGALAMADVTSWRVLLFAYLLICLTVRIAPFPGYLRGSLAAIVILGIVMAIVASLADVESLRVRAGWAILNLTVAMLISLLIVSLLIRGGVGLAKLLKE